MTVNFWLLASAGGFFRHLPAKGGSDKVNSHRDEEAEQGKKLFLGGFKRPNRRKQEA
jgi:hypothetical protein